MATIGSIIPSLPPQSIEVLEGDIKISLKHLLSRNVDTSTHIESVLFFLLFKTQGADKSFYFELPFIQGNSIGVNVTVQSSYLLTTSHFPRTTPSPSPTPTPTPTPTPDPTSYPNSGIQDITNLNISFAVQNTANGSKITIANRTLTEYTFAVKHNSTSNIIEFSGYFIPDNTALSFTSSYTFSTTDVYSFMLVEYDTNNDPIIQLFNVSSYEPIPEGWYLPTPPPIPPNSGVHQFGDRDVSFLVENLLSGARIIILNNTSDEYTFEVKHDDSGNIIEFDGNSIPNNSLISFSCPYVFSTTDQYSFTLMMLNENNQLDILDSESFNVSSDDPIPSYMNP